MRRGPSGREFVESGVDMTLKRAEAERIGRTFGQSTSQFFGSPRPHATAPNVVVIVLDDLGFAQLGCYGADINTPNIDRLAGNGIIYNNFHVTSVCSATRACLLTGRNHHVVGMGTVPDIPMGFPGYSGRIPKSAAALPRILRDAGYSTLAVGKWHLTPRSEETVAGPFDRWPLGLGFERYYGFILGMVNQWTPDLVRDNSFVEQPQSPEAGYHVTEDLAIQAVRMIQDQHHVAPNKPFFLYFATGATHEPHHVAREWIEPYHGRFDEGWENLRVRIFDRQKEVGVVPPDTVLTERPSWVQPWNCLSSAERRLYARMMEVYAGFVSHTDAQIGKILNYLDSAGILENTLVCVTSDNGASAEGGPHGFLDYCRRTEAGTLSLIDELGGFRSFNHYPWGWAWAGNTPFRLWKRYAWLGGVRTPLVIQWPAGISAKNTGKVATQFCHAIDLMPTILDAAGASHPDVVDGISQRALDGQSFLPIFNDVANFEARKLQYFEVFGSRSVYHEGWKATTNHVDETFPYDRKLIEGSHDYVSDKWSLFNVAEDFSEAHDLSDSHPDRLRQMIELWWHEAGRNQVLPLTDGKLLSERLERSLAMDLPPYMTRPRHVYLPGGGPIDTPPLSGGFHLIADIACPNDQPASGVVCAQGDWLGGWACYLLDGSLVVTFNFGIEPSQIVATASLSAGKHRISIEYEPVSVRKGAVRAGVDGEWLLVAGQDSIAVPAPWRRSVRVPKLIIGRDWGFPVCEDYQPPFPFTGGIDSITLEVQHSWHREAAQDEVTNSLSCD